MDAVSSLPRRKATMPEFYGLPFVCWRCGGQLALAASERTRKHRPSWLCRCAASLPWLDIARGDRPYAAV